MLTDYYKKINTWIRENARDLYIAVLIFFTGLGSFGLGRLSAIWPEKELITITNQEAGIMNYGMNRSPKGITGDSNTSLIISNSRGKYVASRSGTAYHYPWCPGAQKIKESNKIWFDTKEGAEKAGYKPAGNCAGL